MTAGAPGGESTENLAATSAENNVGAATPSKDAEPQFEDGQFLKLALELGPLLVFFFSNSYLGIFWATGCFIVATIVALIAMRTLFGRIAVMPLVSGVFVIVFGGLTLWLQNDLFIKLKPTIVNALFAAILLGGLATGHALLRFVFGEVFRLTDEGWRILTLRWGLFFVCLAILNEIVWRNFSTETWAAFKVFGIMPLTMIFGIAQVGVLTRHAARGKST
ncbi:MAG: septation protein A [Hyphomicrobium sp.]|nr:septation protein A [Hyphomicrobium sp.]